MLSQSSRWPVVSGVVPFQSDPFTRRTETGSGPWETLRPGSTVILGPDSGSAATALATGTGKTRLAAAFATRMWAAGDIDLLVWLEAGSRDAIFAGYVQALTDIRVAGPPGRPEAAAARFLTWLAETGRRWLVVLDGLTGRDDADGLWPHGPSGQTVVTTDLAGLRPGRIMAGPGGRPGAGRGGAAPEVVRIGVPAFSPREALDFLADRLNDDPYRSAGALDLAVTVRCMPIALALAVSYLLDTGQDCRQYRLALDRHRRADAGETEASLAASWMLAAERAMQFPPTELVWPALKLAAVLGPGWIPGAVLTSNAACAYLTGRNDVTSADQAGVRATFGNLQQVGLVAIEPADETRTVRMPAALQASVRQVMGPAEIRGAVHAAADAICQVWPAGGTQPRLQQALRESAMSVWRHDDQALWMSGRHPMLVRIGQNLDESGMAETALSYWRDLSARCGRYLGARSPVTFQVREWHAAAALAAGHADEAVGLLEQLAADIDDTAGSASPQALATRQTLVRALRTGGRLSDAIGLGNRIAADSDRMLGPAHALTTAILCELARAYDAAGQYSGAIGALERCVALRAQTLGLMHADTLAARHSLAHAYRRDGRGKDAIRLYQDAFGQLAAAGRRHSRTRLPRGRTWRSATTRPAQPDEAVTTLERALADWGRVPGSDAASTLRARANLAAICCQSGRLKEAIQLYQGTAKDLERIRGGAHPELFGARRNLAAAYHKARRLPEAVELGAATVDGCEQFLGPGHRETLAARANLAHAYHATGQLKRASAHFDRALRDCERALGPADPLTIAVRDLRVRYLAGRQGAAPIVSPPTELPGRSPGPARARAGRVAPVRAGQIRRGRTGRGPSPWPMRRRSRGRTSPSRHRWRRPRRARAVRSSNRRRGRPGWRSTSGCRRRRGPRTPWRPPTSAPRSCPCRAGSRRNRWSARQGSR